MLRLPPFPTAKYMGRDITHPGDHQTLIPSDALSADTIFLTGDFHTPNGYHLCEDDESIGGSCADSCVDLVDDLCEAPPLQDLYRYHVFFSHCADDVDWVKDTVKTLQTPPFTYKCYYLCEKFNRRLSIVQNLLCAVMLSERVVLVLTKDYVQNVWPEFQDILKNLTAMSLHKQRMLIVRLEDCDIPEPLEPFGFLDATEPDFFQMFTRRLKSGRLPRSSESISSDIAAVLSTRANLVNGQVLATVNLEIQGYLRSRLLVKAGEEDIPSPLRCHGINMSQEEYQEMIQTITKVHGNADNLPWVFSLQPVLVLLSAFGVWSLAFVLVIVILVDATRPNILPIRLTVFVFPVVLICCLYAIRWRRVQLKRKISRKMLHNCVHINQTLYRDDRPLLLTASHVKGNTFIIHYVYFNIPDCTNDVDLLLCHCLDEDVDKLTQLIVFYTKDPNYLSQASMTERLTVMMGAPYALKLTRHLLPHPAQERHINKMLCLCQFTEECVSSFIHYIGKEDTIRLAELFSRYLSSTRTLKDLRLIQESSNMA